MNIAVIILILLFCACATSKHTRSRYFDSIIVMKDSLHVTFDTTANSRDTVRYSKKEVYINHSPVWRNRQSWTVMILSVFVVVAVILIKLAK